MDRTIHLLLIFFIWSQVLLLHRGSPGPPERKPSIILWLHPLFYSLLRICHYLKLFICLQLMFCSLTRRYASWGQGPVSCSRLGLQHLEWYLALCNCSILIRWKVTFWNRLSPSVAQLVTIIKGAEALLYNFGLSFKTIGNWNDPCIGK